MPLIYEPSGKAREYSPLALNVYSGGCDHGCEYCYCRLIQRGGWGRVARIRNLKGLDSEAAKASRQVLLSFMGDPYDKNDVEHGCTRSALSLLAKHECSVAILTKGGMRCLRDLDLFKRWPDKRIKVGATLTFASAKKSKELEPGAALPKDRIKALSRLHEAGIKTWASIEPVLDPDESLEIIEMSLPYTDAYKVGKLNHRKSDIDWKSFCVKAVDMIRASGKVLYVKNDLRPYAPDGFFTAEESDCETVFLPDRPVVRREVSAQSALW